MIIYKATNKQNGKVYIGQTSKTLEERVIEHYNSSKKPKSKFHKALQKYTILGFEWCVLEEGFTTKEGMDQAEIYYQQQYRAVEEGYNMVYMAGGGYNGEAVRKNRNKRGKKWNEIYTQTGLETMQNKVLPILMEVGKPYRFDHISPDLLKAYASQGGKSHKGKKESEQTKQNISKGLQNSEKFHAMKQNSEYKKQRSEDTKRNWNNPDSVYNTAEYRKKLSEAKRLRFEKAWSEIRPKLEDLLSKKLSKKEICTLLNISYPTLQKYTSLL